MLLKLVVDTSQEMVERKVNLWRHDYPTYEIIKSETTVSYQSVDFGLGKGQKLEQIISMAIWYKVP